MKTILITAALAAVFVGIGSHSSASILGSAIPGDVNTYEDQNREAVFDIDGDSALSVGDVLIGFSRLDDRTEPFPATNLTDTEEYVLFATQVASITDLDGTPRGPGDNALVTFEAVSGDGALLGLDLPTLTGGLVTEVGALAANFSDVGSNKITTASGIVGAGFSILDLIAEIVAEGSLSTVAGLADPTDFWISQFVGDAVISPVDFLPGLGLVDLGDQFSTTITGANGFFAGLSVLSGDTASFADTVDFGSESPTPFSTHQIGVINGEISGAGNADFGGGENPFFGVIPDTRPGAAPGDTVSYYGAASNADVTFEPIVPEPATIVVWSILAGIGGVVGMRRLRA